MVLGLGLSLLVIGCGSRFLRPPRYTAPQFGVQDSVFTDDLVRAAWFSSYQTPPGFYDEAPTESRRPYYVNTVSLGMDHLWREVSTNDPAQALAWSESTIARSSVRYSLTPTAIVTTRYFEFSPVPGTGRIGVPMRVHRLDYLQYLSQPFAQPDTAILVFSGLVDTASVRGLAEYLWFKDHWYPKVLSSFGRQDAGGFVHWIYCLGGYGIEGGVDTIEIHRLEYRITWSARLVMHHAVVRRVPARVQDRRI